MTARQQQRSKQQRDAMHDESAGNPAAGAHDADHERDEHAPAEIDIDGQIFELPGPVASLIERLGQQRDENNELRLRALADFRNFQRRSADNEARALQSGVSRVVRALLPAMDYIELALNQKTEQLSIEQLLGGVKLLQQELSKALESFDVREIRPAIGEEYDPNLHEAMLRQPSAEVQLNHVTNVLQSGYKMGDMVLRPAKVAVASPPDEE